jgi:hypothetical protein
MVGIRMIRLRIILVGYISTMQCASTAARMTTGTHSDRNITHLILINKELSQIRFQGFLGLNLPGGGTSSKNLSPFTRALAPPFIGR